MTEQQENPIENVEVQNADEQLENTEATVSDLNADELQQQLVAALAEVENYKEQYLRKEAEMQNLRRRTEKDVENAHKFGIEKFVKELLMVADNLERAIDAAGDDEATKAIVEGVDMTRKSFIDTLAKFNVESVGEVGVPFDPQVHQAMSMIENPDMEANTVMAVMQKGYQLHGRLIRPAMVIVSKGPAVKSIDEQA